MAPQGRVGLSRKALPGKARAKIISKFTTSSNVDRQMKIVSVKRKGHQGRRNERAPRQIDVEKRARLEREPSPEVPRPDGKFVFNHPVTKRGRSGRR